MPEIGKIEIDFLVQDTKDPKYLLLFDVSTYLQIEDKPAIIKIYPPGYSEPIIYYWEKGAINAFNSVNLGMSCLDNCNETEYIDLPDGIWCLRLEASPNTFFKQKYYLKTDQFNIEKGKVFIRQSLDYSLKNKDFINWYRDLKIALEAAESHVADGDIVQGNRFFEEAKSILKSYQKCTDCY